VSGTAVAERPAPGARPPAPERLRPASLRPGDMVRVGSAGLRTRPVRVVLSAVGIAIGIAAMVAVLGISASSRAGLQATLDKLGTNLLTVTPGSTMFGEDAKLPVEAPAMVGRIGPVTSVSATGGVSDVSVYRNDRIPQGQTGGIAVLAARTDLLGTVGGEVRSGTWLNAATARYPAVVLGATAAERLGIGAAGTDVRIRIGDEWFTVVGILEPVALADELDSAALVGFPVAEALLGFDGYPSTIYERSRDDAVDAVRAVLPATANPEHPEEVQVSRPSDALAARDAADRTLTAMLLGLGAVALLVGGVGVANTMVISVLERRNEIGLRRALGATRGQVRTQFLAESLLLSLLGGVAGVMIGSLVTAGYAFWRDWPASIPPLAIAGGIGATLVIGGIAGAYPAARAARLTPTAALATT
jgi:putative ABC transport system permease protein